MANSKINIGQLMPVVVMGVIYFLYKKITSGSGLLNGVFGTSEQEKNTKATGDVIQKIPVDMAKASFSSAQASIYAEQLQKAMNPISGFSPDYDGTDEAAIKRIFDKIITKQDAQLVYKAFGVRSYTTNWFLENQQVDLVVWINNELSGSDLSYVKTKLNWMVYE